MAEETSVSEAQEAKDTDSAEKPSPYPQKTLNETLPFVQKIYTDLGFGKYHMSSEIAQTHGLALSSIKPYMSAAQQYKLLELKHKTGFKVTQLFVDIFLPETEVDKARAILVAIKGPDVYHTLLSEYLGHVVPQQTGLRNRFIKDYKLKTNIAEKAAEIFLQNLNDHHLLNQKGILVLESSTALVTTNQNENSEQGSENGFNRNETKFEIIPEDFVEILIPLKSMQQNARLVIPRAYTPEDLTRIAKFVSALE